MYSSDNPNHHFNSNDQYSPTSSPAELVCKYWKAQYSLCGDAVWINDLTKLELNAQEESVDSEYSKKRIQVSADGTYKCLYKYGCDSSSISVTVHFIHQGNGNE